MEKESCLNCKSFEKYDDLDLDDEIFGVCKQDGCHDCCESTKCEQYSPIKPKLMTFNEAIMKIKGELLGSPTKEESEQITSDIQPEEL